MIRRWWRWRRELSRLRRAERRAWLAYAGAHVRYAEAVDGYGPDVMAKADAVRLAGQICQDASEAYKRHVLTRP